MGGVEDLFTETGHEAVFAGSARRVSAAAAGGSDPRQELGPHHQRLHPSFSQVHRVLQAAQRGCFRRVGEYRPGGRS